MQGRKITRIFLFLLLSYLEHHQVNGSQDAKYLNSANLTTSNCSPICQSNDSNDSNHTNRSNHLIHSNHSNDSSNSNDPNDSISANSRLLRWIAYRTIDNRQNARFRRAVTSRPERKWRNGIIPYEIKPYKFTDQQLSLFKQAMQVWESHTCIKFVERKPEHADFVVFTERGCGCCSFIGKKGGIQDISLAEGCAKLGLILHEYGHLVGFWHEHTRPDRDEHVEIIPGNIQDDQIHNFGKMDRTEIDSLGSPYDFYSIMHYSPNTFSRSYYKDTIKPKHRVEIESEIGQRERLSKQDIKQANLLYRCPANGVTLQQPKGSIELSEYLDANRIEKDPFYYEWRIAAPSISEHIMLRLEEVTFHSFTNQSCEENHLLILDGYDPDTSPVMKKFCPNTATSFPLEIRSKTNRMLIIYRKSKQNLGASLNLRANYEFKCGGRLTEKQGIIQSPNYPLTYPANSSCEWSIQVEPNHKILLNFQRFDLVNSVNCLTDYLEVYDGLGESSRLIGKFCSSSIPDVIQSTGNELLLRFISDGFNVNLRKHGFNATYTADLDECELNLHDCDELCFNMQNGYRCGCEIGSELASNNRSCIKTCGGILNVMNNGVIQSPGYEYNEYKNFLHCKWELRASPNFSIFVNFSDFDLEENIRCAADALTIKDGGRRLGKFCGNQLPGPLLSESNKLEIEFNTDKADTRRGFSMNYYLDQNECSTNNGGCDQVCINKFNTYECRCLSGFVLKSDQKSCKRLPCKHHFRATKGTFQSIDFFNQNISNVDCYWILETQPGNLVRPTFTFNNPPPTGVCAESNLIAYDGSTPRDAVLYKSTDKDAKQIMSTKNTLLITYYSTPKCPFSGFQATFASVCGGKYVATTKSQYIYSHPEFGRAAYKPYTECKWQIKSKRSKQIRIRFKAMDIEEDGDRCRYDRLMIYEGSHEEPGKLLHVLCGNQLPKEIVSAGSSLLIKFTTDDTRNGSGFAMIYDELDKGEAAEY